jgi:hypothetical protein
MGIFGRTKTPPAPVVSDGPMTLDEAKASFRLEPDEWITDSNVMRRFTMDEATLPRDGRAYYTGRIRNVGRTDVGVVVNGVQVGLIGDRSAGYALAELREAGGPVRCLVSERTSGWYVYVTA